MHHSRNHVFDGTVKRSCSDVQFVPLLPVRSAPRFSNRNMTVCSRRALDGDDSFFKLAVEIVLIECAENLLQIARVLLVLMVSFMVLALLQDLHPLPL